MINLAIKLTECSIIKRQTFIYDEDLKKYARPHRLTKIHHGTLGRYAPHDWPSWFDLFVDFSDREIFFWIFLFFFLNIDEYERKIVGKNKF